jgi:predicted transposase YdaD
MVLALTREEEKPREAQIKVLKAAAEHTQDAPDISAADILEAAVKVKMTKKPVNKSKRRLKKWLGLKTQFEEVLKDIDDERIVERLQAILVAFTGLIEPKNTSKKIDSATETEEKAPKNAAKATKNKAK